jgi:hypothetical protein
VSTGAGVLTAGVETTSGMDTTEDEGITMLLTTDDDTEELEEDDGFTVELTFEEVVVGLGFSVVVGVGLGVVL